jgi:hypothetical protein
MLLALAALLATSGGQFQVGNPAPLTTRSLHTPDEIAPAVLPYLACLYEARGLPLLRGTDGQPITTSEPGPGGDCSSVRIHAQEEALKLLAGKRVPDKTSPEAFVEGALEEMDEYVATLRTPTAQTDSDHLPHVGTQVMIEDEVLPAYMKYISCLRDKVKEVPLTPENVLGKFTDALDACREIRTASVNEAKEALVKKGWDEQTRQRAAENTFAKADESWTTMGGRLRDTLLRKDLKRNGSAPAPKQQ